MPNPARYSDIDLDFSANPVTGDLVLVTDEIAVKRAVRNLVMTSFYERPMHPEIGSGLSRLLFEPMSNATTYEIRAAIIDVIANYEPRAVVNSVNVIMRVDDNAYEISINITVVGYTEPTSVTLFVERIR